MRVSYPLRRVFAPGAIGTLALPHRIVTGAMHLGLETRDDNGAALSAFYTERAAGGAGLMVTGGAAVAWAGSGGPRYGVLTDGAFTTRLSRVVRDVHEAGGLIALQLFHAGRYAPRVLPGRPGPPVAPSPVFSRVCGCEPRALSAAEVWQTVDDFARAAALGRNLGFDAVEVMGAEGYLIDQFLSPVTNHRGDEWGGDAERRARFGVEVMRAVRASAGRGYPVIFRMTGADLMPGGVPPAAVHDFAVALAMAGADALNIGIGWHEAPIPTVQAIVPPGNWVPVAARIREALAAASAAPGGRVPAIPVIASNRINRLDIAEEILRSGRADFVSMARPFLADPRLVYSARASAPLNICLGCNQACIDRSLTDDGETVSCMVNPRAGREVVLPLLARPRAAGSDAGGRVAVVGGGPAGLTAARELALAGHRVELFEAASALGGQFRLAARVPGKADYGAPAEYLSAELEALGGEIMVGRAITAGDVGLLRSFDGVIVATGVRPRRLGLPGEDLPHVLSYADAFTADLGRRLVIIGGGGVAVDVAHFASHGGDRAVTIVHRGKRIGARIGRTTRWAVLAAIRDSGVVLRTEAQCERITASGVEVRRTGGSAETGPGPAELIPADTVVVAIGQETTESVVAAAARLAGVRHWVIGGARDAGMDAVRAMTEGLLCARGFSQARAVSCGPVSGARRLP